MTKFKALRFVFVVEFVKHKSYKIVAKFMKRKPYKATTKILLSTKAVINFTKNLQGKE